MAGWCFLDKFVGEKLIELGIKKTQGLDTRPKRISEKHGREFQGSMQSLLDTRPVILAYNRDGKLQAVIGQRHSRFTTLTPYIQRWLHQTQYHGPLSRCSMSTLFFWALWFFLPWSCVLARSCAQRCHKIILKISGSVGSVQERYTDGMVAWLPG